MNSPAVTEATVPSVAELVALWPSRPDFAADVGVKIGLVNSWVHRGVIPDLYWLAISDGAQRRGIAGVSLEVLARMRARDRHAPQSRSDAPSLATGT